jgi:hypothetical protein
MQMHISLLRYDTKGAATILKMKAISELVLVMIFADLTLQK